MPNEQSAPELVVERATAGPAGDGAERVRLETSRGAIACRYHDAPAGDACRGHLDRDRTAWLDEVSGLSTAAA